MESQNRTEMSLVWCSE